MNSSDKNSEISATKWTCVTCFAFHELYYDGKSTGIFLPQRVDGRAVAEAFNLNGLTCQQVYDIRGHAETTAEPRAHPWRSKTFWFDIALAIACAVGCFLWWLL